MGDRYKRNACVVLALIQMSVATGRDGFGFSPLTTNYISQHPDYEEVDEEGLYKLRITQAERYNGTRYRCRGYLEGLSQLFFSNEWKLIVTSSETCSTVGMNDTDNTVQPVQDTNSTKIVPVNSTMQAGPEREKNRTTQQAPTWNTALLSFIAVPFAIVALIVVALLSVILACAQRRSKTVTVDSSSCKPIEEDGVVINSVLVMAAEEEKECKTNSTLEAIKSVHRTTKSGGVAEAQVSCPEDEVIINTALQSPQVASSNDEAGAIQIAERVMMYDDVQLQLHCTLTRSVVRQDPAVLCGIPPIPYIHSRSNCEVDSGDVSMYCNPAYVAMESYHQSRPEEATDESFHQPLFPGTLPEDPPLQGNPAYKALETIGTSPAPALGQEHRLQPSGRTGGTEPSEDVPMQDNPAYGALESTHPSMRTRCGPLCSDSSYV